MADNENLLKGSQRPFQFRKNHKEGKKFGLLYYLFFSSTTLFGIYELYMAMRKLAK